MLGAIAPGLQAWLFPPDDALQRSLLGGLGWIGVFLLLVLTGLETELGLIRRLGRGVAFVAIGSLLVPLLAGINLGFALPEAFVGEGSPRLVFALFMGTYLFPGYRYRWLQVRYFFGQLPLLSLAAAVGLFTIWDLPRRAGIRLPDGALIAIGYAALVALNLRVLSIGVFGSLYRFIGVG